ncbi:MAG: 2-isopropylmalate synthase [Chloroflexi bacterium]|nr:2-isopropylmalate synthase [Chloroflexota bacterium]MCH8114692.1 2-isopropylmalate synthase [Chloroflexota bacterium]MCI0775145.1 2-isopropylmalate synthase [Chloroflexota bacterium]MCI0805104.1 2-isopropylmalate synthase [Chloroflexota bacterium]MCI0837650.1 2-isopropylmalate synthase [Chloroflexota bacterium]
MAQQSSTEDRVIIFDTTLRDGEQSAGAGLTVEEKLRIAHQLNKLGVDVIEAGFAGSSPGDFEAVRRIANEVKGPVITSLARAVDADIDAAGRAFEGVENARIHVFISASDIHLMHQMRKDRETIMDMAVHGVERAKSYVDDVEFSAMDASRTEPEYLYTMLEAVIRAGATTVNITDTVGYSTPDEFGALIRGVIENVPNIEQAVISVHCHNDLGMASANSLAAIENGARQVEGCINGLGERAGNAALEEVIMAVETRPDHYGVTTGINLREIGNSSRMVSSIFGFPIQANKAIVGQNAFRHSSGIHQDAFLKERTTFEIMEPESVGWRGQALVLGKLSGRAGLRARLHELGYDLTDEELTDVFVTFKDLADTKREITDMDLEALMSEQHRMVDTDRMYKVGTIHVVCGNDTSPEARVTLECPDGESRTVEARGTGPVDAVCKAIDEVVGLDIELTEFAVTAVTEGIDSLGEVTIRVAKNGSVYSGRGSDSDIVVASAKAYVNAINRLLAIGAQDRSANTGAV